MRMILILLSVLAAVTALTSTITFNGVLLCVKDNNGPVHSPQNFTIEIWEQDNEPGDFIGLNKDDLLRTLSVRPGEPFSIEVEDYEFWDLEPYIVIKEGCQNGTDERRILCPIITETSANVNFQFVYCPRYPGKVIICAAKTKEFFEVEQW